MSQLETFYKLQEFIDLVLVNSESWTREYISYTFAKRDCKHEAKGAPTFNGEVTNWGLLIMYKDPDCVNTTKIEKWGKYLAILILHFLDSRGFKYRDYCPGFQFSVENCGVHITIYLGKDENE